MNINWILLFVSLIVAGSIILIISIYHIITFFRQNDIKEKMRLWWKKRNENNRTPLVRRMHCALNAITIGYSISIIIFFVLWQTKMLPSLFACTLSLGATLLIYIAKSFAVSRIWKCPHCGNPLPTQVTRSGLNPKWVDTCPSCQKYVAAYAGDDSLMA